MKMRGFHCLTYLLLASLPGVLSCKHNAFPKAKYPDLYEASILQLQRGLERKQFTSVDLVKAYLARIDEVNLKGPKLRAVIETNPSALKQAAALDAERKKSGKRSPLHGIPILLKDNIATLASEGMNTTAGSFALLKSIVPGDATVAAKLRKAGAILLGKTNMSEWAGFRGGLTPGWSGRGGQATNPYYPGADPCGSSSGSGVATAIGLAAGSLGTETSGSIICPSSFNNLVGIKPTVGLTSRAGVIPISSHQDTVGPMTRSVADAAVILSVIAGRDKKDNYTSTAPCKVPDYTKYLKPNAIKGKRFGVPRTMIMISETTLNNVAFNKSLETIRALGGVIVDPADTPSVYDVAAVFQNMTTVMCTDFKVEINKYLNGLKSIPTGASTLEKIIAYNDAHKDLEGPKGYESQSRLLKSQATTGYNSTYYTTLRANYDLGRTRGIDAILKAHKLDAIVLPSDGLIPFAAVAGYPIVTVPLGFLSDDTKAESAGQNVVHPAPGMPFGLAFLGTAYSEPSLIGFAYAYEQKTRTRLQRRAYAAAIPKTQLKNTPPPSCPAFVNTPSATGNVRAMSSTIVDLAGLLSALEIQQAGWRDLASTIEMKAKAIAYNDVHKDLEEPECFMDQPS
ncbi:hypothetical protein FRC06_011350 [Ceratobasidium sp. 370]|nr:hypothetical protein FRC06_011350 [Ceratobasidium sp. 370]